MFTLKKLIVASCCFALLIACGSGDDGIISPKPRTYFRLSFPEKTYTLYDPSDCPFRFEIPTYSKVVVDNEAHAEPCWLNLDFPSFNARLHLSYKPVNKNLNGFLEQTYTMTAKHQIKASGIEEQLVSKKTSKVYGLIYNIDGNAASSIQFFLTDSTSHFLRGALYFNVAPNIDSIRPVLEFVRKDIQHLIETFEWKDQPILSASKTLK